MNMPVQNVLIVGGGFSGLAAAIALRRQGIAVEVAELEPDWQTDGIGISLPGAALRVFRTLGILDAFLTHGHVSDGIDLLEPDGRPLAHLSTPRAAGPDVPGCGAIMRRKLARVLADEALRLALRRGEVDFIFGDAISLAFWINGTDSGDCCAFSGGPFVESRYFGEGIGIAVRKGDAALAGSFNTALAVIGSDGEFKAINDH